MENNDLPLADLASLVRTLHARLEAMGAPKAPSETMDGETTVAHVIDAYMKAVSMDENDGHDESSDDGADGDQAAQ